MNTASTQKLFGKCISALISAPWCICTLKQAERTNYVCIALTMMVYTCQSSVMTYTVLPQIAYTYMLNIWR
jgi:hypothetical protein